MGRVRIASAAESLEDEGLCCDDFCRAESFCRPLLCLFRRWVLPLHLLLLACFCALRTATLDEQAGSVQCFATPATQTPGALSRPHVLNRRLFCNGQ